MYAIFPFIILIILLLLTKNNLKSISGAIIAASYFYIKKNHISINYFITTVLKAHYSAIFYPSGYLFPLLLLLIISIILALFEELEILHSYRLLMQKLLEKTNQFVFNILLIVSPFFFFLDDYLSVMGIKSFFAPLLKNTEKNKNLLTMHIVFLAGGGSLLCFLSTWVAVVVAQINGIKGLIPAWQNSSALSIFLNSKIYFFYPLITWIFLILKNMFQKNNFAFIPNEHKNQQIIWEDIFIFLLLPLGIICSFLHESLYLQNSLSTMDAGAIMFHGSFLALGGIIFFLFLFKSITFSFLLKIIKKTIKDLFIPILTLTLCWLFSKIIVSLINRESLMIFEKIPSSLYPCFYFFIAFFTALILGSEWGTFSIIITFLPLVAYQYHNMNLLLGSIISGTLAGAHTTPLSNIQVTASTVMQTDPFKAFLFRLKETGWLILGTVICYLFFGLFIS